MLERREHLLRGRSPVFSSVEIECLDGGLYMSKNAGDKTDNCSIESGRNIGREFTALFHLPNIASPSFLNGRSRKRKGR